MLLDALMAKRAEPSIWSVSNRTSYKHCFVFSFPKTAVAEVKAGVISRGLYGVFGSIVRSTMFSMPTEVS